MESKVNKFYILLIIVFVSGCTTLAGVKFDVQKPLNIENSIREFVFLKNIAGEEVSKTAITQAIVNSFREASEIKLKFRKGDYIRGVEISKTNEGDILVSHLDNFNSLKDVKSALYKLNIIDSNSAYNVRVACPTEYREFDSHKGGMLEVDTYIPNSDAESNFKAICNNFQPIITEEKIVRGEIDSEFSSSDVYANFDRLLTELNSNNQVERFDIAKGRVFKFNTKDFNSTLSISVYPYRGGSKLVYAFRYNYNVKANGTTSFRIDEIEKAKDYIRSIVNS